MPSSPPQDDTTGHASDRQNIIHSLEAARLTGGDPGDAIPHQNFEEQPPFHRESVSTANQPLMAAERSRPQPADRDPGFSSGRNNRRTSSSSENPHLRSRGASSEGHPSARCESPTLTSARVPQRGRKQGREVDEDGGSEPREDWSLDIDDQSTGPSLAKRLPQKKRGKKKAVVKEREGPKVQLKRPWSEAERTAVNKQLGKFMAERRVPGKEDCVKCITQEKSLDQKSWKDVKNFVYNTIVTLNRRSASQKLQF
ncbi:uncharacterized protein LOC122888253 [Siniperca chuatsi]|uniref:uncharacterized protein LOC122888253 n=1 Tax=Siniperca chuatsi TaxID=119488 RepID=UPI001CE0BA18|nr:uncharacterized protein LOC122888253 [Siniperca chuatsi]XP_044078405.1 uncharacterized protein LOC122888253 [Siniperca chuatsi]XP_044078406.1 uncharacterized protein LOC122888253 [Siniperca chuatsi]